MEGEVHAQTETNKRRQRKRLEHRAIAVIKALLASWSVALVTTDTDEWVYAKYKTVNLKAASLNITQPQLDMAL